MFCVSFVLPLFRLIISHLFGFLDSKSNTLKAYDTESHDSVDESEINTVFSVLSGVSVADYC